MGEGRNMIIGFGFGDPLTSFFMLILTSVLSYMLFRAFKRSKDNPLNEQNKREQLKEYYVVHRERAREMMREFDLTDEEIERRVEEEMRR
jgi:hypothetical protein